MKRWFLALAIGYSSITFAAAENSTQLYFTQNSFVAKFKPVFSITTGATLAQLGKSESFAPIDLCSYNYSRRNTDSTSMLWGAFVGSQLWSSTTWGFAAGLGYYQPSSLAAHGTLSQGADAASSDTYQYTYQVKSQQLLAEGKLAWIARHKFQPYVTLGVGAAFNNAYGYQTTVPPFMEFTPAFSSHQQTNFSYAAGVGVDLSISPSFLFGVGYRFADLGKANLGTGQIDNIPIANTLKQSHVYANQILAQLTYIPYL